MEVQKRLQQLIAAMGYKSVKALISQICLNLKTKTIALDASRTIAIKRTDYTTLK